MVVKTLKGPDVEGAADLFSEIPFLPNGLWSHCLLPVWPQQAPTSLSLSFPICEMIRNAASATFPPLSVALGRGYEVRVPWRVSPHWADSGRSWEGGRASSWILGAIWSCSCLEGVVAF